MYSTKDGDDNGVWFILVKNLAHSDDMSEPGFDSPRKT